MEFNRENKRPVGNILDILLDKDNHSEIVLVNEEGEELAFKQVYVTVNDRLVYCILAPVEDVKFLSKDGAFLFVVDKGFTFTVVRDPDKCEQIFSEYYHSLQGGGK